MLITVSCKDNVSASILQNIHLMHDAKGDKKLMSADFIHTLCK